MEGGAMFLQGLTIDQLRELIREDLRVIVRQEIAAANQGQEKLLSPAEVCKLFQPKISRSTLHSWTELGRLQSYFIGGRKFYKQSEVLDSLQTLKRFKLAS